MALCLRNISSEAMRIMRKAERNFKREQAEHSHKESTIHSSIKREGKETGKIGTA